MRQEKVLGKPRASGSSGHKACPGSESSSHSPTRMTHLTNGGTETQRVFSTSSMEESPCSIHQPTSSLSVDKTIFKTIKRERNGKKDRKHKPVLGQRKEQHLLFNLLCHPFFAPSITIYLASPVPHGEKENSTQERKHGKLSTRVSWLSFWMRKASSVSSAPVGTWHHEGCMSCLPLSAESPLCFSTPCSCLIIPV